MAIDFEKYKALVFDCDGTLADTMPAHCAAYKETFEHYGVPFTEEEFYLYAHEGGKNLMQKMIIDKKIDVDPQLLIDMKSNIVGDYLDNYMIPNKVLIDLIEEKHKELKIAVVSNGRKKSISTILEKLGLLQYVDVLLTSDDVTNTKPNPEPYLKAIELLGTLSSEILVFEDNEVGYLSAKSASGLDVIMVEVNKELGEIR